MNNPNPHRAEQNHSSQRHRDFLSGGGEMGRLIRTFDWSQSPLGEPDSWPQSLRTTVRLMLNTNHPVFIFWGEQLICLYNDAYRATMGPERHPTALGAKGHEVWSEIWHIIEPEIKQVMLGHGATWNEFKLIPITRNGKIDNIWWTYSYSPIDDDSAASGIGGVLVICTEVTAQHDANEALKQERERLMALFKQAPGFMAVLYGPEHTFNLTNDAYTKLVGKRDLIGLTVKDAFPELAGQGFYELLDWVYQEGKPYIGENIEVSLQSFGAEAPGKYYLNFIYQPIRDEHSNVIGIFVEGYDNTPSKLAEIALRETLEKNTAIIENTKDLVCVFDRLGCFLDINNSSQTILGYTPAEMLGKNFADFIFEEDIPASKLAFSEALAGKPAVDFENRYYHRDGQIIHILWSAVWVPKQNKLFAIGKDITERIKAEQLVRHAQRLDAIGNLTGGIAHDFNNLLTVILGNAELLTEQLPKHSEQLETANIIFKASERGAVLIQRLLAFARRQPLSPQVVNINKTLADFEVTLQSVVTENIKIDITCNEEHLSAFVDSVQLEIALLNLCLNARDAMPSGGHLKISASKTYLDEQNADRYLEVEKGHYVVLNIIDTGIGIPSDNLNRVFDPFFTTKDVQHGSGLGLSMVMGFVKQSRGHITLSSELGQGTVVKMFIPEARDGLPEHHF